MKAYLKLKLDEEKHSVEIAGDGKSLVALIATLFHKSEGVYKLFDAAVRIHKEIIEDGGIDKALEKREAEKQSSNVKPLEVN